jgi:hypothetical protein
MPSIFPRGRSQRTFIKNGKGVHGSLCLVEGEKDRGDAVGIGMR